MAFSPQFLDELRARASLADMVGRRVRLTRKGRGEHAGLCPFHKEKTPSFTLNEEKGFYHCFGCGAHGTVFDFVMQTEGLGFPEAVARLAAEAGMEVPVDSPEERERNRQRQTLYDVMEAATVHFEKCLRMPEGRGAMDYLLGRGLRDETISRFRLGFAPDSRGTIKAALARAGISEDLMVAAGLIIRPEDEARAPYDRFRKRIMFPITDRRGRMVAFGGRILGDGEPKYLNSPETPLFHKGSMLYGMSQAAAAARKAGSAIVTEGYTDVIALHQAGFDSAVAPLGTALTEDQMGELWRLVPEPVLCFDGDDAGRRAAARAAERALPLLAPGRSLRFAMLPAGEDPDSLIRGAGPEAMSGVLGAAVSLSDALWWMETGGRRAATSEAWAALQKRLEDHAGKITDPTIRSHFRKGFRDRVWQERRRGGDRNKRSDRAPAPTLDDRAGTAIKVDGRHGIEQTLVAVAVNHPGLFDRIGEQLGSTGFSDPSLDGLRQAIVSALLDDPDLDRDGLIGDLRNRGAGEALDKVFGDPLIRGRRLIAVGATPENVLEVWEDNLGALGRMEQTTERQRAGRELAEDMTPETWARRHSVLRPTEDDPAD